MNKTFSQASVALLGALLLTACGQSGPGRSLGGDDPGGVAADPAGQTTMTAMALRSGAMAAAARSTACSLDQVNASAAATSTFTIDTRGVSTFRGWAVDATNSAPPSVTIVFEGAKTYGLSTLTGQARPDVAKILGSPAAQRAGFFVHATLEKVPAGTYRVLLWIDTSTGNTLCNTGKQTVVER